VRACDDLGLCQRHGLNPFIALTSVMATRYAWLMKQRWEITDEDVDAAIDFTIENGAADRAQTVNYTRVFAAAGLPPPQELHHGAKANS
jgi:hypothetical protein